MGEVGGFCALLFLKGVGGSDKIESCHVQTCLCQQLDVCVSAPAAAVQPKPIPKPKPPRSIGSSGGGRDAVALDMGEWRLPGFDSLLSMRAIRRGAHPLAPTSSAPLPDRPGVTGDDVTSDGAAEKGGRRGGGAGGWVAAARGSTKKSGGSATSALRVYQVLPPALCARAHVFGNKMALKAGSRCLDLPYFDAPGEGAV